MGDLTPLAIQSRIQQLAEIGSSNCCAHLIEEDLLRECVLHLQGQFSQIIAEYSDVSSLQPQDKDTYLENLKGELSSLKAENAKISDEVGNLTAGYFEDFIQLQSKIEEQKASLEFIQSQGLKTNGDEYQLESEGAHDASKFKILELNGEIEKGKRILASLENLDYTRKRFEGFVKMEDALTGLKVIEYDGNRISLSIRTYLPEVEMDEQNHELAIELLDGTLELKNAEIFPNDVYIGEIIGAAQSMA
ncbi:uncharacterized protein LOC143531554 [Bidens hawaiensis]|uniref:uncharacterized protein LOC143531554 n=1 Tax=Bidens hawaiensis TaxID=980011 RepID=UPI00404AA8FF